MGMTLAVAAASLLVPLSYPPPYPRAGTATANCNCSLGDRMITSTAKDETAPDAKVTVFELK